jgi:RHS repeat-associated protein
MFYMKKEFRYLKVILLGLLCCVAVSDVYSQHLGAAYPAVIPVNYIRTWDAAAPEQDVNVLMARQVRDVVQRTQYVDGLGRVLQDVIKQGSLTTGSNPVDLVMPVEYDELSRMQYKYLPFTDSFSGGAFRNMPFTAQRDFYTTATNGQSPVAGQGETYFYGKINYEPSPLNRAAETYAPGNSWAGSENNPDPATRRGAQVHYGINTSSDAVHIWNVIDDPVVGQFGSYSGTVLYPEGALYKTIITDSHKKQTIEFTDKQGRIILRKLQLTASGDDGSGSGYTGWICTYYIYDIIGNLRCVIQPEGVKAVLPSWTISSTVLDGQCFRYEYDQRNRLIVKKTPGAASVWMVYDAKSRLVLSQDGNARALHKWLYSVYDDLNRVTATGLITDPSHYSDLSYHLNAAYSSNSYPNTALYTSEELSNSFYDNYNWLANYGNPLPAGYNTGFDNYLQAASNQAWPYPQHNAFSSLTNGLLTGTRTKILGTANFLYAISIYNDKGQVIQVKTTNISGGIDIVTTQYTWNGKPLVMVQQQEKSGINAQTTVVVSQLTYDDLGRVAQTQKRVANTMVNSNVMTPYTTTAVNEYNCLGQLRMKKLAPEYNGNAGLETQKFDYNIRGWMLGMNRDYAKDANNNNYFGFDLGYDRSSNGIMGNQSYTKPQYNGNIEGMVWKSRGDGEKRKYDFVYDAANRLMKADFTQFSGSGFNQMANVNYDVKIGDGSFLSDGVTLDCTKAYDDNGNILLLQQWGLKINTSERIDNLRYTYEAGSNRLKSVTDFDNAVSTLGDFRTDASHPQLGAKNALTPTSTPSAFYAITDYAYNDNGNLAIDNNKSMTGITYNCLNLPSVINTPKGTITYTYDASGVKLKKEVVEHLTVSGTSKIITTINSYISGFMYESRKIASYPSGGGEVIDPASYTDVLKFFAQEEGRVRLSPAMGNAAAAFRYDYKIKDHLGNVRMVLTDEVRQDKYPVASLETSKLSIENTFYDIQSGNVADKVDAVGITDYNNDNGIGNNPPDATFSAANSAKLYRLNSNSAKSGLGITLKVMAGDRIDVFGKSYYFTNATGTVNSTLPVLDLLTSFLSAPSALTTTAGHGVVVPSTINTTGGVAGINSMMTEQGNQSNQAVNKPRSFINVLFFDEEFKTYPGAYKVSMVGDNSVIKDHNPELNNLVAAKNGYVYVYCSNETPVDVFFDNIQVVHSRGPVLEESHFYPFGLRMEGISSRAAGELENRFHFNNHEDQENEFSDGSGMATIDFDARMYDAQTARFWQQDPMTEYMRRWSPYSFGFDNPVNFADYTGMIPVDTTKNADPHPVGMTVNMDLTDPTGHTLEHVYVSTTKKTKADDGGWGWGKLWDGVVTIAENTPFLGSAIQIGEGIYNGDWKQVTMGVVMLGVDVFTAGEGGEALRIAEAGGETLLEDGIKVYAKDEVEEVAVKEAEEVVAEDAMKIGESCGCFLPGTLILTDSGYKRIEQVKVGDLVWSFDNAKSKYLKKQVIKLYTHVRDTVYQIHIGEEVISATGDHPFFIAGRWLNVDNLHVGDSVSTYRGTKVAITEINIVYKKTIVYNFEVADFHNYYVSRKNILVHNCGGTLNTKEGGKFTEPTLPDKTIVNENGVKVEHYTKSGDHGPPHAHVKGGGPSTKIGQNGKPLRGSSELSARQQQVINNNKATIRSAIKKIGRYNSYNNL